MFWDMLLCESIPQDQAPVVICLKFKPFLAILQITPHLPGNAFIRIALPIAQSEKNQITLLFLLLQYFTC